MDRHDEVRVMKRLTKLYSLELNDTVKNKLDNLRTMLLAEDDETRKLGELLTEKTLTEPFIAKVFLDGCPQKPTKGSTFSINYETRRWNQKVKDGLILNLNLRVGKDIETEFRLSSRQNTAKILRRIDIMHSYFVNLNKKHTKSSRKITH